MKKLLVTGTDTDVGKTWISSALIRLLASAGFRVGAYKPVCSGAEIAANGAAFWHDVEALKGALSHDTPAELVCPQTFQAAVAPNVAARAENRPVNNELLYDGIDAWQTHCDYLIIEGAGGLMCPLSDSSTVLDLAKSQQTPLIVVADNRLGVINHTMLTVDTAERNQLNVAAVVLNQRTDSSPDEDPSRSSNATQLHHWLPNIKLVHCGPAQNELHDDRGVIEAEAVAAWFA